MSKPADLAQCRPDPNNPKRDLIASSHASVAITPSTQAYTFLCCEYIDLPRGAHARCCTHYICIEHETLVALQLSTCSPAHVVLPTPYDL